MSIRLKPAAPMTLGEYDLDAFVVELGDDEGELDFRFELGQGVGIYRALPAGRLERIRLVHVDGAYHLPEPVLVESPWRCDVPRMSWQGELGRLGDGRALVAVHVEATARPASYRCELVLAGARGDERRVVLAWREPGPGWAELALGDRYDRIDSRMRELARGEAVDPGEVAMLHELAGELFDAEFLDGAQHAAMHQLREAARRGDEAAVRVALARGLFVAPPPSTRVRRAPVGVRLQAGPVLSGHRGWLAGAAFSPDGARLVSGDADGVVVLWGRDSRGPATGYVEQARDQVANHDGSGPGTIRSVAWSPAGDVLAINERHGVRARLGADLSEVGFAPHVGAGHVAFGGGGAWLAVLGEGSVTILRAPSLQRQDLVVVSRGPFEHLGTGPLAVHPAGPWLAVADDGGSNETAMGMRLDSGVPQVTVAGITPDRPRFAIARGDHTCALAFDPWRDELVAASHGGKLASWGFDGTCRRAVTPFGKTSVCALAITRRFWVLVPDESPGKATLELWDPATLERAASTPVPGGICPRWIAASPDGGLLVTPDRPEGRDHGLRLWTIEG